ncbi:MAG: extracellular solute-binding protein [Candidatus Limiplasma sp.]|nr:extracellular solute-binding protein [Candidatus Limiplasma sp.]
MKKWIALLLSLCLLLTGAPALAASVSVTTARSDGASVAGEEASAGVASLASLNGTLYVLYTDGRLAAVDPATKAETPLGELLYSQPYLTADEVASAQPADAAALTPAELLFIHQDTLCGLCAATGQVSTLLDASGAFAPQALPVTLQTAGLPGQGEQSKLTVLDACVLDGALYLLTRDDSAGNLATALASYDLSTGAAHAYTVQNLQNIAPYQGGKLLARRYDMTTLQSVASADDLTDCDYGLFTPADDTYQSTAAFQTDNIMRGYAIGGMVYSPDNDTLYYANGSKLEGLTYATGAVRTSAYTSEGMLGGAMQTTAIAYVQGGYYAKADANGWQVIALDTDAVQKGALRIFGEFGSEAHQSFAKNYPDIPTEVASDYSYDIESLANAMVSDNNAYDVLLLILSYMPVEKLIEKGYCTDLSAYPEIMQRVAGLDPRFTAGVTVDGKLYGVPVSSSAFSYGVNLENWKALGLTEADLPTNLIDFYDFINNYADDYGDDHPDLRLFDMGGDNIKTLLFSLMLDNYIVYGQTTGNGEPQFDDPLFREVLDAFEQLDFDTLAANSDADAADYGGKQSVFSIYMSLTTFSTVYEALTPLVLSLTPDTQPVLGANLSVLILNPRSQRKDDAVKYICNYLDNLDDSSAIVLHPDDNEPRLDKYYEQNRKGLTDEIAKQQALLETADESSKAGVQDTLDQLNAQLEVMDAHRYSVTAEQIATFRNVISDKLAVCQQSVLYSADKTAQNELSKLLMQYLDGATTQDAFVKEMDKRTRMMQLEAQ